MNQPVQHHYLPKHAYLKFFESPQKEDFIWMYQRGQEAILVNIENAARERHLYSFIDENKKYNSQLESALAEMENVASLVLKKLNDAASQTILTSQEKADLAYFLAMQFARTPAFRDSLKKQAAELAKLHMQTLASDKETLAKALDEVKKRNPGAPDIGVEKMQEFVFGEKYEIKMGGEGYFLKQAIQLGDAICPTVMMKDMSVLRSASVELITSDYPVNLVANPTIPPFYAGGFLMSGILFPIGVKTALFCKNPENPKNPPSKEDKILVGYREIPPTLARWINKITINRAERFLFGSSYDPKIKDIFDKTSQPQRFYMSSPFSKNS